MKNRMLICMAIAGGLLTSCGAYRKYRPVSSVPDNLYGVETVSYTHLRAHETGT